MSATSDYLEKRKTVRYELNVGFSLTINETEYIGITGNISLGGVYLQDIEPEIPGALMAETGYINLSIPETPITLDCKIVYANCRNATFPSGAGVEFSSPDKASLSIIQNYIASQS